MDSRLRAATRTEYDLPAAFHRIEEERQFQWLQRLARRHQPIQRITVQDAFQQRRIEIREARIAKYSLDSSRHRRARRSPADPMTTPPVVGIPPLFRIGRKRWIRPGIPGVNVRARDIDHRSAVDVGDRIGRQQRARRVAIERLDQRLQDAPLHQIITFAVGKSRQRGLCALRIDEYVRLVRAFVDSRTTDLKQPHRLRARNPCRRRVILDTCGPIVVRIAPPRRQILEAKHPRLARTVRNRRTHLRCPIGVAGVKPVKTLTADDVGFQIIEIID